MALQTKTYTVGTGVWDSTYVGFVLTLNITENSTSQANNTSNISYELILSNPNNQYTYEVSSATRYVELVLGSHTLSQDVTGSWVFNSSTTQKVLLSGSVDIAHNSDGSSTINIYAKMPTLRTDGKGPQEMVISDAMTLTSIQRIFTNTIHHVKLRNDGSEVSRETTSFTATYGTNVTIPSSHVKSYTGYTNNGTAYFYNRYELPNKSIGDTFVQPAGNVAFDYLYYPNVYTVTYHGNGGSSADYGETWSEQVTYETDYYTQANWYERQGYTFVGWNEQADGSGVDWTSYINQAWTYYYTKDVTLYAQWTPNTYKVTLDNQGAITAGTKEYWYLYNTVKLIDNQRVFYYADSGLSSPIFGHTIEIPTKTGYTFGGYFTGVDGAGTQYINPEGLCVNDLYSSVAADTTLYAKWIRDANMIFNDNIVDKIVFNGQPVTSLVFNGNVIY